CRARLGGIAAGELVLPGDLSNAPTVLDRHALDRRCVSGIVSPAGRTGGSVGIGTAGADPAAGPAGSLSAIDVGARLAREAPRTNDAGGAGCSNRRGDASRHGDAGDRNAGVVSAAAAVARFRHS